MRSAPSAAALSIDRRSRRCATPLLRRARRRRGRLLLERTDPAERRLGGALAAFPGAVDRSPQRRVGLFARAVLTANPPPRPPRPPRPAPTDRGRTNRRHRSSTATTRPYWRTKAPSA